ncbi:MAG: hypothetical protein AAB443_01025 [Patescibacteria group bacterium]
MKIDLPKLIFFLLIFTTIVTFLGRVHVLNDLATRGSDIKSLDGKVFGLSKENEELKEQIMLLSSLNTIKDKALAMGLIEDNSPEFLTSPVTASVPSGF